jgi:hypothetical protein
MTAVDRLARDYRSAFVGYLSRREETQLDAAYNLGRRALASGVSVLDLARVHHEVFLEHLLDAPRAQLHDLTEAAAQFLLEALASYDMTHRPPAL